MDKSKLDVCKEWLKNNVVYGTADKDMCQVVLEAIEELERLQIVFDSGREAYNKLGVGCEELKIKLQTDRNARGVMEKEIAELKKEIKYREKCQIDLSKEVAVLEADQSSLQSIVRDLPNAEKLLIDIYRLDKTPEYGYGKKEKDRDNCGRLAGVGKRWLTPKELIKDYFWKSKRDIHELVKQDLNLIEKEK